MLWDCSSLETLHQDLRLLFHQYPSHNLRQALMPLSTRPHRDQLLHQPVYLPMNPRFKLTCLHAQGQFSRNMSNSEQCPLHPKPPGRVLVLLHHRLHRDLVFGRHHQRGTKTNTLAFRQLQQDLTITTRQKSDHPREAQPCIHTSLHGGISIKDDPRAFA